MHGTYLSTERPLQSALDVWRKYLMKSPQVHPRVAPVRQARAIRFSGSSAMCGYIAVRSLQRVAHLPGCARRFTATAERLT
jgi:hypothetical protein